MNKIKCPELLLLQVSVKTWILKGLWGFFIHYLIILHAIFYVPAKYFSICSKLAQIGIYVNKQAGGKGWDKSDILLIFSKILPAKS